MGLENVGTDATTKRGKEGLKKVGRENVSGLPLFGTDELNSTVIFRFNIFIINSNRGSILKKYIANLDGYMKQSLLTVMRGFGVHRHYHDIKGDI